MKKIEKQTKKQHDDRTDDETSRKPNASDEDSDIDIDVVGDDDLKNAYKVKSLENNSPNHNPIPFSIDNILSSHARNAKNHGVNSGEQTESETPLKSEHS